MTRIVKWLNSWPVLAFLLTFGALVDLVLIGLANGLSKSDWASWVQAVGSIAAIAVAFVIANYQLRQTRKLERLRAIAEDERKLQVVRVLLTHVQKFANDLEDALKRQDGSYVLNFSWTALLDLRQTVQSIRVLDLPSATVVFALAPITTALESLASPFQNHARVGYRHSPAVHFEWLLEQGLQVRTYRLVDLTKKAIEACDEAFAVIARS